MPELSENEASQVEGGLYTVFAGRATSTPLIVGDGVAFDYSIAGTMNQILATSQTVAGVLVRFETLAGGKRFIRIVDNAANEICYEHEVSADGEKELSALVAKAGIRLEGESGVRRNSASDGFAMRWKRANRRRMASEIEVNVEDPEGVVVVEETIDVTGLSSRGGRRSCKGDDYVDSTDEEGEDSDGLGDDCNAPFMRSPRPGEDGYFEMGQMLGDEACEDSDGQPRDDVGASGGQAKAVVERKKKGGASQGGRYALHVGVGAAQDGVNGDYLLPGHRAEGRDGTQGCFRGFPGKGKELGGASDRRVFADGGDGRARGR